MFSNIRNRFFAIVIALVIAVVAMLPTTANAAMPYCTMVANGPTAVTVTNGVGGGEITVYHSLWGYQASLLSGEVTNLQLNRGTLTGYDWKGYARCKFRR